MAYSRYDNSFWYTYWRSNPDGFHENRTNAVFVVADLADFHAAELRKDKEGCIDRVLAACRAKNMHPGADDCAKLSECMDRFLAAVDKRYPKRNA